MSAGSQENVEKRGVYYYTGNAREGELRNRDSILWSPHLYTVSFDQAFIGRGCPKIYSDFVEKIFDLMHNRAPQAVYAKYGYSIITTKQSIRKHMNNIDDWEFYYEDGNKARNKAILNSIHGLNSYILEDGFDLKFESKWQDTLLWFIQQLHEPKRRRREGKDQYVEFDAEIAYDIFAFFLMMQCRNPRFNGIGVLAWLDKTLQGVFEGETETMIQAVWYSELYRMLFQNNRGFYNNTLKSAMEHCQMICFEAKEGVGTFITSDNPSFLHQSTAPEQVNRTGYVFPISPKHLLFMGRGTGKFSTMMYRMAEEKDVKIFNGMIYQARQQAFISSEQFFER